MRILSLVALALLLSGCAPNTDAAFKNCKDTLSLAVTLDDTLTDEQKLDKLLSVVATCIESEDADPVAFNEQWGD